jgi:hypothetical protein
LRYLLTAQDGAESLAVAPNSAGQEPIDLAMENPDKDEIIRILMLFGAEMPDESDTDGGGMSDGSGGGSDQGGSPPDDDDKPSDQPGDRPAAPARADAVLVVLDEGPANLGSEFLSFRGYTARIPSVFDRRLRSRENPREVRLYFDNWIDLNVEIYKVGQDGRPEAVARPEPYETVVYDTRQANVFVVFDEDGEYYGSYTTTGEAEQRVRIDYEEAHR